MPPEVTLRRLTADDLPNVGRWLNEPHVARWFLPETTVEAELEKYRRRVAGLVTTTTLYAVELAGRAVGWCQWYCWDDYASAGKSSGAQRGEMGADYAIGEPQATGKGVGTEMVRALVKEVRTHHPGAGLLIVPEAENWASRRVLEKNGFLLAGTRPLPTEPHDRAMALYRLAPSVPIG